MKIKPEKLVETHMDAHYINFYFKNLVYDDDVFSGTFMAPDNNVLCEFWYDRQEETFEVWNNNKPVDEILPIPVWWLMIRLKENGALRESESRICY